MTSPCCTPSEAENFLKCPRTGRQFFFLNNKGTMKFLYLPTLALRGDFLVQTGDEVAPVSGLSINPVAAVVAVAARINLRDLITLGRISSILYKRDNFCDFLFAFLHTKTLLKWDLLLKERICSHREQILSF